MVYTTTSEIISHKVLNEDTGELERKNFQQVNKKKRIRGGFRMTYKDYDIAVIDSIKSATDLNALVYIRDQFTYARIEVVLSASDIAKQLDVGRTKIINLIKRMMNNKLLYRVGRGVYRLNPFMYVPFRANAEELQAEWNQLLKARGNK